MSNRVIDIVFATFLSCLGWLVIISLLGSGKLKEVSTIILGVIEVIGLLTLLGIGIYKYTSILVNTLKQWKAPKTFTVTVSERSDNL